MFDVCCAPGQQRNCNRWDYKQWSRFSGQTWLTQCNCSTTSWCTRMWPQNLFKGYGYNVYGMSQTCPYDWTSQIWGRVQVKWSKVCSFLFPTLGMVRFMCMLMWDRRCTLPVVILMFIFITVNQEVRQLIVRVFFHANLSWSEVSILRMHTVISTLHAGESERVVC